MKKLSFLLVALALFCFISLNSCKQKAGEAEQATEEVVEEGEEAVKEAPADTVAEEAEGEAEETME
jgi:large-conductance mechanosensitive channel